MDAVQVAKGPLEGKEHRTPERYFADVLEHLDLQQRSAGRTLFSNEYTRILSLPCMIKTKPVCNIMFVMF